MTQTICTANFKTHLIHKIHTFENTLQISYENIGALRTIKKTVELQTKNCQNFLENVFTSLKSRVNILNTIISLLNNPIDQSLLIESFISELNKKDKEYTRSLILSIEALSIHMQSFQDKLSYIRYTIDPTSVFEIDPCSIMSSRDHSLSHLKEQVTILEKKIKKIFIRIINFQKDIFQSMEIIGLYQSCFIALNTPIATASIKNRQIDHIVGLRQAIIDDLKESINLLDALSNHSFPLVQPFALKQLASFAMKNGLTPIDFLQHLFNKNKPGNGNSAKPCSQQACALLKKGIEVDQPWDLSLHNRKRNDNIAN